MPVVSIRPREECRYDAVSLGEVMLRLDPGEGRIRTNRQFRAWEGGGEYNVARGLRRVFGQRTAVVTSLVDNEVGRLVEDLILTGGVDTSFVRWVPGDGLGRSVRNGLNFTERGYGIRGALGVSDRGHTAVSQLKVGDIDWEFLFGELGVRWFHTGGIFAGLSTTTPDVAEEAMTVAKRHGTVVSYDLNYRPSVWEAVGGPARALEVNRRLARHVDVMFGCLNLGQPSSDESLPAPELATFQRRVEDLTGEYDNLRVVATTLRTVHTATVNDWGAIAWTDGQIIEATHRPGLEILDRVGGGDAFAAGLIYGLLSDRGLADAVELGATHGALAMTTPGDTSMATKAEVERLVAGGGARAVR